MDTGQVGVWHPAINRSPALVARKAAVEIEKLGYGSVWLNESLGTKDPFVTASLLLSVTQRIAVGTGIANLWARDATAMAATRVTLGEAFPGRFLLGIGVSHSTLVGNRGHAYAKPLTTMRDYLQAMDQARPRLPEGDAPRLLAALRPKMLELARDQAGGAHTYFVPPEHTALAREVLGAHRLLVPEQAVLLEADPVKARAVAREHMAYYLTLPNYVNNLRELGFTDDDLGGGGSDRLTDALVAWGDQEAIAKRVHAHLDAGADHVVLQPLSAGGPNLTDALTQLRTLAPTLNP